MNPTVRNDHFEQFGFFRVALRNIQKIRFVSDPVTGNLGTGSSDPVEVRRRWHPDLIGSRGAHPIISSGSA
jgi:hypothetical protein